ncbi:hypothetical protein MMC07_001127 [Pseudocyphellaria aurata]|nr:hypothetical protein [Pseudocyphellaria aurata]
MSLTRLNFLYPHLFKTAKVCECGLPRRPPRRGESCPQKSTFSTSAQRRHETYAQRYGTAAEPQPPPIPATEGLGGFKTLANTIEKELKPPIGKQEEKKPDSKPSKVAADASQDIRKTTAKTSEYQSPPTDNTVPAGKLDGGEFLREPVNPVGMKESGKSLETVLHMDAPDTKDTEEHKLSHLHAPPYLHHFDTFTLVRDLQKGGFTEAQSVTLMKAVRSLLAINLDIARQSLVSKSDIENETYLFRAACSELRTEILNARKASTSKMATQRAHLQHEVDIISQKASQDSLALKDDLRGMLNDRKMAVRMQHQARDSKIQELNYKITVALNSDSKSEVEGLRWTLTRRAAMAIAGMAFLILGALRYSTYQIHQRDLERQISAAASAAQSPSRGGTSKENYTVTSREMATQTGPPGGETHAVLASAEAGDGGSYVSLG